mmetsp:Transcript_20573/g.53647  ORF Transcript_20573/g.53647 Transcript_20573/m.53647 type:complete len:230 (+) Transcript_20573:3488-4177(+)
MLALQCCKCLPFPPLGLDGLDGVIDSQGTVQHHQEQEHDVSHQAVHHSLRLQPCLTVVSVLQCLDLKVCPYDPCIVPVSIHPHKAVQLHLHIVRGELHRKEPRGVWVEVRTLLHVLEVSDHVDFPEVYVQDHRIHKRQAWKDIVRKEAKGHALPVQLICSQARVVPCVRSPSHLWVVQDRGVHKSWVDPDTRHGKRNVASTLAGLCACTAAAWTTYYRRCSFCCCCCCC